jgi:TetR/AcrR family transcriptional repressor of nem operon
VADLASDVARSKSPELTKLLEETIILYIDNLIAALPAEDKTAKRRLAWAILSEMIGAVILARVTSRALSGELTRTVVADLLERRDRSTSKPSKRPRTPHRNK